METVSKSARILDRVIAVIFWATLVVTVIGIVVVIILFFLHSGLSGRSAWPLTTLTFGNLELTLHPDAVPEHYGIYLLASVAFLLVKVPIFCIMLCTVRDTLKPFIARQPFHDTVARNLRRLAILVVLLTAITILGESVLTGLFVSIFDPASLLRSKLVPQVSVTTTADLTPLIFAGVLYLLSRVFLYGHELQTLSDETL